MEAMVLDLEKIEGIKLESGAHGSPQEGLCVMEAVAFVAGEKHSDHPRCVSNVIGAYARSLNDRLPDEERQKLLPFIPKIVGTSGDGLDEQRRYLLADWSIRVGTPRLLDAAGMSAGASRLRALAPVTSGATLAAARQASYEVRDEAYTARTNARAALRKQIEAELAKQGKPVADAAAVAAAVADAAAVAVAAAAADAVAAAAADAAADAVAAAAAAGQGYWHVWNKVYDAVKPIFVKKYQSEDSVLAQAIRQNQAEGIDLLGRLVKAEVA